MHCWIKSGVVFLTLVTLCYGVCQAQESGQRTVRLWSGKPPGQIAAAGDESDTSKPNERLVAGKPVIRLGNVSEPMLTIFSPSPDSNTGAAVMVCPGGGYNILAYDLEGTEVCEWLNSIGVTGVLLKYRVPRADKSPLPAEPLQDAQRGMRLIRANASKWGIDGERVGALGFSAGGNLVARLSNLADESYPSLDESDQLSSLPDFAVLIYPAYLVDKDSGQVAAEVRATAKTPPTFMSMSFDDGVGPENILQYGLALKKVGVPTELHLFPSGGHGYGMRHTDQAATDWPVHCALWMRQGGWLAK